MSTPLFGPQPAILVVDDFEPMRKVTVTQLRQFGLGERVVQADNGAAALRLLEQQPFDIILSDWNMPVTDGLQLLQTVRGDPRWAHLPFVMITAESERGKVQQAIEAGVSDVLLKPYTADTLVERVQRARRWQPRRPAPEPAATAQPGADAALPNALDAGAPAAPGAAAPQAWLQVEEPPPADPAPPAGSGLPTLLVVDDTPDNLQLMTHLFKDRYRVKLAHNGARAISICHSDNPPDLVLLDVMMPDMDGFEVAARLREHPASETIPIIFVTALGDAASLRRGMALGAVDFVSKPFEPDLLQARVSNFMRYVQLQRRLQDDYDLMLANARLREQVEQIAQHDLRGPLAGILGLVQTLEGPAGADPRLRAEHLDLVQGAALQMLDMINLSSELFKIETGTFQLKAQPLELGPLLQRTAALAGKAFHAKGLEIVVHDSASAALRPLGDAALCHSLFQNLLKNACEASPDWCRVDIEILAEGEQALVRMVNRGTVPPAIRARFWDKFASHGKAGGSGIGTYSARLLAEAQNGSVAMHTDDELNRTTISVRLPCAAA